MYNFQKRYPYYDSNGITATSANYIANLGKEQYRTILKELENITFYTTEASIAGIAGSYVISRSISAQDLAAIPDKLKKIYTINALIAWLREAIKKRQSMIDEITNLTNDDYAKMTNQSSESIDSELKSLVNKPFDIAPSENWDIDDMWDDIYGMEQIDTLKQAFQELSQEASDVEKYEGKTTSLEALAAAGVRYNGTVCTAITANSDELRNIIEELKNTFIEVSKETFRLNEENRKLDSERKAQNREKIISLGREKEAYMKQLHNTTRLFKATEKSRVSKLRIIIPDTLRPIFDELNTNHNTNA